MRRREALRVARQQRSYVSLQILSYFGVRRAVVVLTKADLATDERTMLGRIAGDAALAYARAETDALRGQVAALELRLSEARTVP